MSKSKYDVIVVGARVAGSPTAMLLARKGYRVLLVDRAGFPSDTISTHLLQPSGVAAMKRLGLLEELVASGCPPIEGYTFDFGDLAITGRPGDDDSPVAYAPRRIVLDKILLDAATRAGAVVREHFVVDELLFEEDRVVGIRGRDGGRSVVTEHADVVVGADGITSVVAAGVGARAYNDYPKLLMGYYAYFSGLPMGGHLQAAILPGRGFAAFPTHDDLTLVLVSWPYQEFLARKADVETTYYSTFEMVPEHLGERLKAATRETRLFGKAVPNFMKKPYGPGWALVGDAGYVKDFVLAQGISDALVGAEACVARLDEALLGDRSFADAMSQYQRDRDEHSRPIYELNAEFARLDPPDEKFLTVLQAIRRMPAEMDAMVRTVAGTSPPDEFFGEANMSRLLSLAATAQVAEREAQDDAHRDRPDR